MPVPTNYRWLLEDPEANLVDYRLPVNPNKMTSPYRSKNLETQSGPSGRMRTKMSYNTAPFEWTWSGKIRDQDHYDKLLEWSRVDNAILITDHLGRQWSVLPQRFNPDEKRPSARVPDKWTYDFVCLVLGGPL